MIYKIHKNGFSLVEAAIVLAVLTIFSAVAIPAFNCVRRRAISTAAQETIRQIKEECEANFIYGIDKFTSSNPDKYQISASGSNSCSGGTVTLTPEDTNLYPTYLYKFADSELSYNFKGQTGTSFVACNKLICGESNEQKPIFKIDDGNNFLVNNKDIIVPGAFISKGCSTYVIVNAETWEEGESNSQKLGGNLLTINNVEEYKWLQQNLWLNNKLLKESGVSSNKSTFYFVGLNDVKKEGQYEWSSGQKSEFDENIGELIHKQNWLAQQWMAPSKDYFVIGGTNDVGFTDYTQDYKPELYNGVGGGLTWVDNNSSWNKQGNDPAPHYAIAEVPTC